MKASIQFDKLDKEDMENNEQYAYILFYNQSINTGHHANDLHEESTALVKKFNKNIQILIDNVIYHLIDKYDKLIDSWHKKKEKKYNDKIISPYICDILPNCVFNKSNPIVIGVKINSGVMKLNSLISTLVDQEHKSIILGRIIGIKNNKNDVESANKGLSVSIKIVPEPTIYSFEKDFNMSTKLCSYVDTTTYEKTIQYSKIDKENLDLLNLIMNNNKL